MKSKIISTLLAITTMFTFESLLVFMNLIDVCVDVLNHLPTYLALFLYISVLGLIVDLGSKWGSAKNVVSLFGHLPLASVTIICC